eukprot:TRINITY_DN5738_c0_g2_i1.p1 TRINITY_DN5738_c0_g2~~TRINITY_DN5738_c0_g2_i1.p1  ORF type:complete len:295 (+),score=83.75 TRINITY_DN5738_c0_g2_i1:70-885(+)
MNHNMDEDVKLFYEITEQILSKNRFSRVCIGKCKEGKGEVAIKEAQKSKREKTDRIKKNALILKKMDHPYLLKMYDIFLAEETLHVVMELAKGRSLKERLDGGAEYNEKDAKQLIRKLFSVIEYLHSFDLVYKDLEPDKILIDEVDETSFKLISDIGLSKICTDNIGYMCCALGTPHFIAPEVLECRGYSKPVDMWSAGAILYLILCGYPPFYSECEPELFESIMTANYQFYDPHWVDISHEAKDLISQLLVVDTNQRLSSTQALDHPWFR